MRSGRAFASRRGRASLLAGIAIGWALIALGIVGDSPLLAVLGAFLAAAGNLVLAKALFEMRSTTTTLAGTSRRVESSISKALAKLEDLRAKLERLETAEVALREEDASQAQTLERFKSEAAVLEEKLVERIRRAESAHTADNASQSAALDEVRSQVKSVSGAHDATRIGLATTRAITDKLANRIRIHPGDSRLAAVSSNEVDAPFLSIGIPSFNRPSSLFELLASVKREVEACPQGVIEVCITDDASTDPETLEIALAFAEENRFASLRAHPANIGLERNLIGAASACRGEFLLVIGNDDVLAPGALPTIVGDLRAASAPVLLYAKDRIKLDGTPHDPVPGTTPIELEEDGTFIFESLFAAARRQGLLSTFGFAGQIVTPRVGFLAVDPTPYLDLTMYSRSCVTIQAFAKEPLFYRNRVTILHRTPTLAEKHSEAIGRPEEEFMGAGLRRRSRYLGTALAAALQRLIDHGAFRIEDLVGLPENLMSPLPLLEWVAENRRIDPDLDNTLGADVTADANRLFAAFERAMSAAR